MKYKLFTAADPSDSKKIGVVDICNMLPEIDKQGNLCWRSRPGLVGVVSTDIPFIRLYKTTTTRSYHDVGDIIEYTYEVKNNGSGEAFLDIPYEVIDDKILVEFPQTPARLEPGESILYTLNYSVVQGDLDAGSVVNTAYATAWHDDVKVTSLPVTVTVPCRTDCLYDGSVFEPQEGFLPWDIIDNITGNYSCTPGEERGKRIITYLTTGAKKTCYFIYKVTDFVKYPADDSIYLQIQNGSGALKAELISESTLAYINLPSDRDSLRFITGYPLIDEEIRPPAVGTVYVECVKIMERDWESAGENIDTVYYL